MKNSNLNTYIYITLLLIICTLTISLIYMESSLDRDSTELKFFSRILGLIALFIGIYFSIIWSKLTNYRLSLFSMFILSFLLFNFGQTILFAFNLTPEKVNLYERIDLIVIVKAQIFSLNGFITFFLGALISLKIKVGIFDNLENEPKKSNILLSIKEFGIILFFITAPFAVYLMGTNIFNGVNMGYNALNSEEFSGSRINKALIITMELFTISLFMLLISFQKLGMNVRWIKLLLIFIVGYYLLLGERTTPTAILGILLWFSLNFNAKKKKVFSLKNIVLGVSLLTIFPIINRIRNLGLITPSSFIEAFKESESNLLFIESFAEFGYSLFPLTQTMILVPNTETFRYGSSYLFALTAAIPNVFGGTHISVEHSALAQWLMKSLNMSYGPGFSIPAEAYINFGWLGIISLTFVGGIFGKFLTLRSRDKGNSLKILLVVIFFYMNLTAPRREILGVIRDVTIYIIPLYFIILLRSNYLERNSYAKNNKKI